MIEPEILDLLGEHVGENSSIDRELRLYERLTPARRAIVNERLPVLDRFLRARAEKAAKADAAADGGERNDRKKEAGAEQALDVDGLAASIGLKRRTFYHLLARMAELGPVSALAPAPGAGRKRRSDAGGSISEDARNILQLLVTKHPRMRQAEMLELALKVDPSAAKSTLRRELLRLKADHAPARDARFGRAFVLDTVAVNQPVRIGDDRFAWLVLDLVLDVDTRVVVAEVPSNLWMTGNWKTSHLVECLEMTIARASMLLHRPVKFASSLEEVTWVVPTDPYDESLAILVEQRNRREEIAPHLRVIRTGRYRQGVEAVNILGPKFGLLDMLVRSTPDPLMYPREGDLEPVLPEAAAAVASREQLIANQPYARALLDVPGTPGPPSPQRVANLRRLMEQLVDLFVDDLPGDHQERLLNALAKIGSQGSGATSAT